MMRFTCFVFPSGHILMQLCLQIFQDSDRIGADRQMNGQDLELKIPLS